MIYAAIDVDIIAHERALACGMEAFGLWAWCMCWTQKYTTDGRIPKLVLMSALAEQPRVLRRALVRLVASGLLNETGSDSFELHNYGKKNQTASEIEARRAAGKAANAARQQASRDRRNARVTPEVTPRNGVTVALRVTEVTGLSPSPEPTPAPPVREIERPASPPEPVEPESKVIPIEPVTSIRSRRRAETPCPDSDTDAGKVRDWADTWTIPVGHGEFAGFLDYHRSKDTRNRDWAAAWRTWLRNAPKFAPRLFANGGGIVQSGENRAWKLPEGLK